MILRVKNWREFQHYSKRRPPWIKLHHGLLDDRAFLQLPDASGRLAPLLWLIASEHDGEIHDAINEITFRLRMSDAAVRDALAPLLAAGFLECEQTASTGASNGASEPLAERKPLSSAQSEERRGEKAPSGLSPLPNQESCSVAARASEPEGLATPHEIDLTPPDFLNRIKRMPT